MKTETKSIAQVAYEKNTIGGIPNFGPWATARITVLAPRERTTNQPLPRLQMSMTAPASAAERAAYIAEVTKAFADGKPIEFKPIRAHVESFVICREPSWQWPDFDYRVKPEEAVPRTVTLRCSQRGMLDLMSKCPLDLGEEATFTELPPGWEVRRKD